MHSVVGIKNKIHTPHLEVRGGYPLKGFLKVSGAKNSSLVLMAASLLTKDTLHIKNTPKLADIEVMKSILKTLGVKIQITGDEILINARDIHEAELPEQLVHSLRASFFCIGPLLARLGKTKIPLPGGCKIGARPVDDHINGLKALGAKIEIKDGIVSAFITTKNQRLKGANITLSCPSVGATETILMAASLASGTTEINNAAQEPEIKDLAKMLNNMGATITGAGTSKIIIKGVNSLRGTIHNVIPDRIEAGTFLIAAAITRSTLKVGPIIKDHLTEVILKLQECGCRLISDGENITIIPGEISGVEITTNPFPGFPTDLQAPFMALMITAKGKSKITEKIYESRMQHVEEFRKMGASIKLKENIALIEGVNKLRGSLLTGGDLRSSAAIILASIAAQGTSSVFGLNHLDRGYEAFEEKLNKVGANMVRNHNIYKIKEDIIEELGTPNKLETEKEAA